MQPEKLIHIFIILATDVRIEPDLQHQNEFVVTRVDG